MAQLQKIVPNLWFDTGAEEAAKFYTSIFENSDILRITHYGKARTEARGNGAEVDFRLEGQSFTGLNGGPEFKFNEALSLLVNCDSQEEVDYFWEKLSDGGEQGPCGWLKDRFGVSWQIVPTALQTMLHDEDEARTNRVMEVMLQMGKLEIAPLEEAYSRSQSAGRA